jgi:lipopolysaccharide export LptBFGC system permease protein LptF
MTILDRYLARQFLVNAALLLGALLAVIVVIDFSLNFDEFVEIAQRIARERGWEASLVREGALAVVLVVDLWWPRAFQLFHYMLGAVMVGAMGFTCAQMVRHREFVAMLAGGISLRRACRGVVAGAALLSVAQVLNAEFVLPELAPLLTRDKNEAGQRGMGRTRQPLTADASGRLFYARSVDLDAGTMEGLWVWERDERGLMTRRITAPRAAWDGRAWVLENGLAHERTDTPGQAPDARPVRRLETDLDPTALRLRRFEGYSGNLSTSQLSELISRLRAQPRPPERRIAQLERIRASRPALVLANFLTLLCVLPLFVRREPTNMLAQSVKAAPLALGAIFLTLACATAEMPALPPWASVFLPVVLLLPLSVAALTSMRT